MSPARFETTPNKNKSRDLTPEEGRQIATLAEGWRNTNYAPRGTAFAGPKAQQQQAADCSGSVWAIYRQAGLDYRYADTADFAAAAANGTIPFREVADADRQPGDVVLYPAAGHMSIYAGDGMVWSAHKANLPFSEFRINCFDKGGTHRIYRYQETDDGQGI